MAVQVGPTRAETLPTRATRQLPAAPGWLRRIGIGNLLATMVFTAGALFLVAEQPTRGGAWAYVIVVLAVLPLLAMREHPVAAPIAVAALTLIAQLTVGPIVTCGVVLPVIFVMTFQLGSRLLTTIPADGRRSRGDRHRTDRAAARSGARHRRRGDLHLRIGDGLLHRWSADPVAGPDDGDAPPADDGARRAARPDGRSGRRSGSGAGRRGPRGGDPFAGGRDSGGGRLRPWAGRRSPRRNHDPDGPGRDRGAGSPDADGHADGGRHPAGRAHRPPAGYRRSRRPAAPSDRSGRPVATRGRRTLPEPECRAVHLPDRRAAARHLDRRPGSASRCRCALRPPRPSGSRSPARPGSRTPRT